MLWRRGRPCMVQSRLHLGNFSSGCVAKRRGDRFRNLCRRPFRGSPWTGPKSGAQRAHGSTWIPSGLPRRGRCIARRGPTDDAHGRAIRLAILSSVREVERGSLLRCLGACVMPGLAEPTHLGGADRARFGHSANDAMARPNRCLPLRRSSEDGRSRLVLGHSSASDSPSLRSVVAVSGRSIPLGTFSVGGAPSRGAGGFRSSFQISASSADASPKFGATCVHGGFQPKLTLPNAMLLGLLRDTALEWVGRPDSMHRAPASGPRPASGGRFRASLADSGSSNLTLGRGAKEGQHWRTRWED